MITLNEIQATGISLTDHKAIADALSIGRTKIATAPIGVGTVLAVMAPIGGDFLNTLETLGSTDANVKWALKMIEQGTFDVGHPVTRAQLEVFASIVPSMAEGVSKLLAVAVVQDPISINEVSAVIERG